MHDTYRKKRIAKWERDLIKGSKFRDICSIFGLTPEELLWDETFNPRFAKSPKADWTEPIDVEPLSLEEQVESVAEMVRTVLDATKYIEEHFPLYLNYVHSPEEDAIRELESILQLDTISTRTPPSDIPSWAWKGGGYSCRYRSHVGGGQRLACPVSTNSQCTDLR